VGLTQDSPVLSYRNFMLNRIKGQGLRAANKKAIISHGLNALRYYVMKKPLKKLIPTNQGLDFFHDKQRRTVVGVLEAIRL
jgi:hypothetical protein